MVVRGQMLADTRRSIWFVEPFSSEDLDEAATWLHRNGLADGMTVSHCEGPVKL
jgi:hypothetical protein